MWIPVAIISRLATGVVRKRDPANDAMRNIDLCNLANATDVQRYRIVHNKLARAVKE